MGRATLRAGARLDRGYRTRVYGDPPLKTCENADKGYLYAGGPPEIAAPRRRPQFLLSRCARSIPRLHIRR